MERKQCFVVDFRRQRQSVIGLERQQRAARAGPELAIDLADLEVAEFTQPLLDVLDLRSRGSVIVHTGSAHGDATVGPDLLSLLQIDARILKPMGAAASWIDCRIQPASAVIV